MAENINSLAEGGPAARVKKRKLFSTGITGAIVAAITVLECATIYICLVGGYTRGKAAAHRAVAAGEHGEHVELRDVDLGRFSLTAIDPNSSGSLLIEFHLIGSLAAGDSRKDANGEAKRNGPSDDDAFEKLFQHEKSRFRDTVITVIGNAQISALSDPDFAAIEQEILARTNSLLGGPPLKDIRFSEFAVVQQ